METARRRLLRTPSTETLFVLTIVLFGFRLGAQPIGDNSMFAHLRTGIDMVNGAGIPRSDPYSFTARGHPWVVQSWLAEWTYGMAERIGGLRLVILEQAVLMAALAWLVVRLARAGTPLRTALAGSIAVGAGAAYWTQRPLLFGLICLALTVLAVERRWNPWWLVPIVWVWVNTHGSFPLGVAYLGARMAGEWLDERRVPSARASGTFLVGLAAGALNPLGPKLLTFAVTLGDKRDVFKDVTEWRSPNFQASEGWFTLIFVVVALLIVLPRRIPWRHTLPWVGFLAMGLLAMRNLSPAAVVLAPALGSALRPEKPVRAVRAPGLNWAFVAVLVSAFVLFAADGISGRPLDTGDYPVAALRYLRAQGLVGPGHRIAHTDIVGDYLILELGRRANVFTDDRFDMYPVKVSNDFSALLRGGDRALDVVDEYAFDTVLWERRAPLVALLKETGEWRTSYERGSWIVLQRR